MFSASISSLMSVMTAKLPVTRPRASVSARGETSAGSRPPSARSRGRPQRRPYFAWREVAFRRSRTVGVHQIDEAPAEKIRRPVIEHVAHPVVDVGQSALDIEDAEPLVHRLHQTAGTLLALAQRLLGALVGGDPMAHPLLQVLVETLDLVGGDPALGHQDRHRHRREYQVPHGQPKEQQSVFDCEVVDKSA